MKEMTTYDQQEFYKNECQPLVDKLVELCQQAKIPLFVSAAVENHVGEEDEKGYTKYKNDGVMTGSNRIKLVDDKIKYYMMVSAGCIAAPSSENMEIMLKSVELNEDGLEIVF